MTEWAGEPKQQGSEQGAQSSDSSGLGSTELSWALPLWEQQREELMWQSCHPRGSGHAALPSVSSETRWGHWEGQSQVIHAGKHGCADGREDQREGESTEGEETALCKG